MEKIFVMPNGVRASVRSTDPRYDTSLLGLRKNVSVVFQVAGTEALKRVICRFIDLPVEEREGLC